MHLGKLERTLFRTTGGHFDGMTSVNDNYRTLSWTRFLWSQVIVRVN